jgi:hypothetical protein
MSIRIEYLRDTSDFIIYYSSNFDIIKLKESIQCILGEEWAEFYDETQWLPTFRYIPNNGRGIRLPTKRNWYGFKVEQGYTSPITSELKRKLDDYLSANHDLKFEQYKVGGCGYIIKIIPKYKK